MDVNEELKFCENSKKNWGGGGVVGSEVRWRVRLVGGSGW